MRASSRKYCPGAVEESQVYKELSRCSGGESGLLSIIQVQWRRARSIKYFPGAVEESQVYKVLSRCSGGEPVLGLFFPREA